MTTMQHLFLHLAELLIATRYKNPLPSKLFRQPPIFGYKYDYMLCNNHKQLLLSKWSQSQQNEMVVQFFLESDGQSFLVEEWCLIHQQLASQAELVAKKLQQAQKQLIIWFRSVLTIMSLSTLFQEDHSTVLSHELRFQKGKLPRRAEWLNENQLEVRKLNATIQTQAKLQLTIAQQGLLAQCLAERRKPIALYRCRFHSEQIEEQPPQLIRKNTMDTHCSSSNTLLNKSFISLYSKKEEVEFFFTPEEAHKKILDSSWKEEDFEVQLVNEDNDCQGEIMSHLKVLKGLSYDERLIYSKCLLKLKSLKAEPRSRSQRKSYQITRLRLLIDSYTQPQDHLKR